ncbi:hypothetical protein ACI6Q2_17695 [Chitinophagaceae bacterium LWZ2-11]
MSLPVNNKGKDKGIGKSKSNNIGGSKFIAKPGKAAIGGSNKKVVKTGGSRGS